MRCTCVTGKLWKHEVWNAVICRKGGDPSMLRFSSTRRIIALPSTEMNGLGML